MKMPIQIRIFGAGEAAQQHIHRRLGGEGGEEYGAAPRSFRVGIGQPGRQRWRSGVDQEADQDQPGGQGIGFHRVETGVARGEDLAGDPGEEDHAAGKVDRNVAPAGSPGRRRAGAPEHQRRPDRHELPEQEHGDQVAGEGDANRRAGIEEGGGNFQAAGLAQGEQATDNRHQQEDGGEQARKLVHRQRRQPVVEPFDLPQLAFGQAPKGDQRKSRR